MKFYYLLSLVFAIAISLGSCVSYKQLTSDAQYFKNIGDSVLNKSAIEYEPVFQKGDILSISVVTPNENSAKLFNQSTAIMNQSLGNNNMGIVGNSMGGYLIDEKGNIVFPVIGQVRAEGLTRARFVDTLSSYLSRYIDSAIVSVRLQNYRVTVLGEVSNPGTFTIPSERVTILDAIGLAGDLTVYGKRNNVRIIRSNNGKRETTVLDLNKGDIFDSPFFYLRQNDIVYVEMNERKIPNTDQASLRNVSVAIGIISALGVIASIINVLK